MIVGIIHIKIWYARIHYFIYFYFSIILNTTARGLRSSLLQIERKGNRAEMSPEGTRKSAEREEFPNWAAATADRT